MHKHTERPMLNALKYPSVTGPILTNVEKSSLVIIWLVVLLSWLDDFPSIDVG